MKLQEIIDIRDAVLLLNNFSKIRDEGDGIKEATRHRTLNPFFTTTPDKKVGLGLLSLAQSAEETGGPVTIESAVDKGTTITAEFILSHIDRKPLGKLEETIRCLEVTLPDVNISFNVEHLKSAKQ